MEKKLEGKIYYIWDAYCPWCYGFNKVLKEFYENHKDLDIEVVSGGLLVGERIKPIKESGNPNKSLEEIIEIYGVEFGEEYKKVTEIGDLVRNSYHPANGFAILREKIEKEKWLDLSFDIHKKYFVDGISLSEKSVYLEIAKNYGLNVDEIEKELDEKLYIENPNFEDFKIKQELGVKIHPSVRYEKNGEIFDIRNGAYTVQEMEDNFSKVK